MTDDTDPVWRFISGLPPALRGRLNRTETLVANIHAATRHGWTTNQLITEATRDPHGAINEAAVVNSRIKACAQAGPSAPSSNTIAVLPFCTDDCRRRAGWLENDHGDITGRCPCRTAPQEARV